MTEIRMLSGKHKCGREMDMRIADVKEDDRNIVSWIIYGICKRCNVVLISDLFLQPEEPVQGMDFIIDYDKISDEENMKE